jgi:glycerol-3-phosphate acyltransferase PlsY
VAVFWVLLVFSFLLGAVPCGHLIALGFFRRDIRQLGSGNIGMTNVWRVCGAGAGIATLLLDTAKGLAPVLLARWLLHSPFYAEGARDSLMLGAIALAAVLGHTFTPFLKFKGGKGIATGLGIAVGLLGWYVLIPLGVFAAVLASFRYVSLASLTAVVSLALATALIGAIRAYWWLGILAAALVFYTHRSNIARLVAGKENRLGSSKRTPPDAEKPPPASPEGG